MHIPTCGVNSNGMTYIQHCCKELGLTKDYRYMPSVIAKFDSRAAKFFVSASFILATIGNQVAAGTYPFSNVSPIHKPFE